MRCSSTGVLIWVHLVVLVCGVVAKADLFIPARAGCWSKVDTWLQNGVPATRVPDVGHRDWVIIQDYDVVVKADDGARLLWVLPDRRLHIQQGHRLRLSGGADIDGTVLIDGGTLQIDGGTATVDQGGTIEMKGQRPVLRTNVANGVVLTGGASGILVYSDATISGRGEVRGEDPCASIYINCDDADSVTLTLKDATIRGSLTIAKGCEAGEAYFHNGGVVRAGAGMLLLDASLDGVTDGEGSCAQPRWRAEGPAGILSFEVDAVGLKANFHISGVLRVDASDVTTSGAMRFERCGKIQPINGGSFSADGACAGGACTITGPIVTLTTCPCP